MTADLGEDDREALEMVDYLAGASSTDRAAAVRERLDDDPAFAARMRPIVAVWTVDVRRAPATEAGARGASATRTAWLEVQRRIATSRSEVQVDGPGEAPTALFRPVADSNLAEGSPFGLDRERGAPSRRRWWIYRGLVRPVFWAAIVFLAVSTCKGLYLICGPGWVDGHVAQAWDRLVRPGRTDIVTRHAYEELHRLPDGTTAVLGLMTWIQYPDRFGTVSRDVGVEGYATFDVVQGGVFPFRVYASGFEIEGDGKFTVDNLYPGRPVAVWVTSGVVRILTHELDTPTTVPAGHVAHVTSEYIQVDTGTVHRALY
jgi:hypothetical protein